MEQKIIKIGLVGLGTVGSGVWRILEQQRDLLTQRVGAKIEIARIVVLSKNKPRSVKIPASLLTDKIDDILNDPQIPVVVELMGGVKEALDLARRSIEKKKHFISANKALFALHGKELFEAAKKAQVDICFEAAVGGGIPILRALREGYVANRLRSILGIVNGTCNYILSEMSERGSDFNLSLANAQKLGYAEADPSFDVNGIDSAHKLAILIAISYGVYVDFKDLYIEGIRRISLVDIDCARRFGYAIKLLAICKEHGKKIQARVHPTMIPSRSMLAAVQGVHNAIRIDGDFVGEGMLYGRGAGSEPTASAVVGDIVEVARNLLAKVAYTVPPLGLHADQVQLAVVEPMAELQGPYYLRFQVFDKPGILAQITAILGEHSISISSVYQNVREEGKAVPVVIFTHEALEKNILQAIAKIDSLDGVQDKTMLIRIEPLE